MKIQSYYRELFPKIHNGDFEIIDEPLIVNCTGFWEKSTNDKGTFNCFHGRKDYYLIYLTEGSATARLSDTDILFSRGEFIIYKPHTEYCHNFNHWDSTGYLWVHFTGFHAQRLLSSLGIETNRIYKTHDSDDKIQQLYAQFERLFDEIANRRTGFDTVSSAIFMEILVYLSRETRQITESKKKKLTSITYLHRHFKENTPLEILAAMENLSTSRYRDIFKTQTGFSPTDYRTMLRIQHSCELLAQTDCTMNEIATESGYTDVYYFLRIFKAKEGITPGEYRARAKQVSTFTP